MTSPTEQAPAAGVEAIERFEEQFVHDGWADGGARSLGMLPQKNGAWVKYEDARATIADLEARLRTARADALEEAAKAIEPWYRSGHIQLYAGEMSAQELQSVQAVILLCLGCIYALNPPEKPHDAS